MIIAAGDKDLAFKICEAAAEQDVSKLAAALKIPGAEVAINKSVDLSEGCDPAVMHAVFAKGREIKPNSPEAARQLGVVCFLLNHKSDPDVRGEYGWAAIHQARTSSIATVLLDAKADIDAVNDYGWTPLMNAVYTGRVEVTKLLLERGADISSKTIDGKTALDMGTSFSATAESVEQCKALVRARKASGGSEKHEEKATKLTPDKQLCEAAANGDLEALQSCLKHEIDLNKLVDLGDGADTPLIHAVFWKGKDVHAKSAEEEKQLRVIHALVEHKANCNVPGDGNHRALHYAKTPAIAKLLLEMKANIDAVTSDGFSALMSATYMGRPDVVRVLLDHGAQTDIKNSAGQTATELRPKYASLQAQTEQCRDIIAEHHAKHDHGAKSLGLHLHP